MNFHKLKTWAIFWGWLLLCNGVCCAQEPPPWFATFAQSAQTQRLELLVGETRHLVFDQAYERFAVTDNRIALGSSVAAKEISIKALAFGHTQVLAWAAATAGSPRQVLVFDLYVQVNLASLEAQLKQLLPKEQLQLRQAQHDIVLTGTVSELARATQAQHFVEATGLKVRNLLKLAVPEAAQVQLALRLAEIERRAVRELNTAIVVGTAPVTTLSATIRPAPVSGQQEVAPRAADLGSKSAPAPPASAPFTLYLWLNEADSAVFIRGWQARSVWRELAASRLMTPNSQTVSYLAGSEFPFPVLQAVGPAQNTINVVFKELGVKLNFQPQLLDETHLQLVLEPETTSPDFSAGVNVQGVALPGLRLRHAKMIVELRAGQSCWLSGFLDSAEQASLAKLTAVGEAPVLGELFKSRGFQRNETELLLTVTANPQGPTALPQLPGIADVKGITPLPGTILEGASGHAPPVKKPIKKSNPPF